MDRPAKDARDTTRDSIEETLKNIRPPSAAPAVREPPDGLGELGRLGERLARLYRGREVTSPLRKLLFIAAADHGTPSGGITAYPQGSTAELLRDLLEGRTVVSKIAARSKLRTVVADFGVKGEVEAPAEGWAEFVSSRVRADGTPLEGTEDVTRRAAMSRQTALAAVRSGVHAMKAACSAGEVDLVGTGAVGLGGEVAACAIAAVLTGEPVAELAGGVSPKRSVRGRVVRTTRGPDRPGRAVRTSGGPACGAEAPPARRRPDRPGRREALARAVQDALDRPSPDPIDPLDAIGVLSEYGGLEIGALAGACLAAAELGLPVVLGGLASTAAAAVALDLAPAARSYFIASDLSALPAHGALLEYLGLAPLLGLGLDLGEGAGAALAMEIVDAAWGLVGAAG